MVSILVGWRRSVRRLISCGRTFMSRANSAGRVPWVSISLSSSASRRHRASVKEFVQSGKVERAAEDAAPHDAAEERELLEAEKQGAAPARK